MKQKIRTISHNHMEAFRHLVNGFFSHGGQRSRRRNDVWEPPMDVYETQGEVVLKLSLPGVRACDVRVEFDGDEVTIAGHREGDREESLVAYHRMEIRNGCFERRLHIHRPINPEETTAEYEDGFLWIRVPKAKRKVRTYSLKLRL